MLHGNSEIARAMFLGAVQGIAEFLPISSSGHIVIVDSLMAEVTGEGFGESALALNVALHVGSLLSILVVFWRDILELRFSPRTCGLILLASIPVAVVGLAFENVVSEACSEPLYPALALLATAVLLIVGQRTESGVQELKQLPWYRALVIGLFQAIAIIPGISRSGSTIAGGLLLGLDRTTAARFSFLLAIPPIAGAGLLKFLDLQGAGSLEISLPAIATGMVTSFVVGYFALQWLLKLITQNQLHRFAVYCVVVAGLTTAWRLPVVFRGGDHIPASAPTPTVIVTPSSSPSSGSGPEGLTERSSDKSVRQQSRHIMHDAANRRKWSRSL